MKDNIVSGSFLLMAVYALGTIMFVPGSILTWGAGFAFKYALGDLWKAMLLGSIVVWVGASIGDTCCFLLSRFIFRDYITKKSQRYPLFRAIQKAVNREGMKLIICLRLVPVIPYVFLNYLMGITDIKLWHYVVGNIALLPGTIAFVFVGTTLSDIAQIIDGGGTSNIPHGKLTIALVIVGCVFGCSGIVYVTLVAKRILKEEIAKDKEAEQDKQEDPVHV
jgi:uncharacterized membrane protein YdjX (TVP38/TMEM64 family)